MIVNAKLIRARRMELGMTTREVARAANVSQNVIKRIEDTGDLATLQVDTVNTILRTLALDWTDVLAGAERAIAEDTIVPDVGALLLEHRRALGTTEIAATLGVRLDQVEAALPVLEAHLRGAGLRLHRASTGVKLAAVARPDLGSDSISERLRYLNNLNQGDYVLLYRISTESVPNNTVAANASGKMSLQKLVGAGLVVIDGNALRPTESLETTLATLPSAPSADAPVEQTEDPSAEIDQRRRGELGVPLGSLTG